jgi:hypothetical protein
VEECASRSPDECSDLQSQFDLASDEMQSLLCGRIAAAFDKIQQLIGKNPGPDKTAVQARLRVLRGYRNPYEGELRPPPRAVGAEGSPLTADLAFKEPLATASGTLLIHEPPLPHGSRSQARIQTGRVRYICSESWATYCVATGLSIAILVDTFGSVAGAEDDRLGGLMRRTRAAGLALNLERAMPEPAWNGRRDFLLESESCCRWA